MCVWGGGGLSPTTFSEASGGKTWVGFQRDRDSVCRERERDRERERERDKRDRSREMARVCMSSFLMMDTTDGIVTSL